MNQLTRSRCTVAFVLGTFAFGACSADKGDTGPAGTAGDRGAAGSTGGNGQDGTDGTDGTDGDDGLRSQIRIDAEPAGANCPFGGDVVRSGLDDNGDGTLAATEVDYTAYICDAAPVLQNSDVTIDSPADIAALRGVTTVQGNLVVGGAVGANVDLSGIQTVLGNLEISNATDMTSLNMSGLLNVGGNVDVDENALLTNVDMGRLRDVGGYLYVGANPALDAVDLRAITFVGEHMILSTGADTLISAKTPTSVGSDLYIGDNTGLAGLTFSGAMQVGGDMVIHNNTSLGGITNDGLILVGHDLYVTANTALTDASANAFADGVGVFGDVIVDGNTP